MRLSMRIAAVIAATMGFALAGATAQGATLYQHCNYEGYSVTLPAGSFDMSALIGRGMTNDDVSSIRVPAGNSITIYEHAGYGGRSMTLTRDDSCLVGENFNDAISSVKVAAGSAAPAWQAPTGEFSFFDEESKTGDTTSNSAPQSWLTAATDNWMARLPDSTQLRQISVPGTHDSGARFGGAACETQSWTIRQQLDAGIRYFDIRNRRTGTSFAIHHGPCFQNIMFGDVMNQIQAFLTEHPKEVILMRVKEEHDPQDGSQSFTDIWNSYMGRYGSLFAGTTTPSTTLGSVRGKVVVLRNASMPTSYGMGMFGNSSISIQDSYKVYWLANDNPFGEGTVSLSQKNRLIGSYIGAAASQSQLVINHLSGAVGMIPADVAGSTNDAAYEKIGPNPGKKTVGVLVMDYPGDRLVYRIIKTNFQSTVRCAAREWGTYSDASYAKFKMPTSTAGTVITIKGGAYSNYVFPKCNRATWTDLRFSCGNNGQWSVAGSWDADALCHDSNTSQSYLEVGDR